MNQFVTLLKNDFRLIYRYNILWISLLVTTLYFFLLRWMADSYFKDQLLVLIIFNDPALLGFLFIGVMVLFERDEASLQALSVTPIHVEWYLLSKVLSLSLVATICSLLMAFAAKGLTFSIVEFTYATMTTSINFSFIGVMAVATTKNFNAYFIRAIVWILVLTLPFLSFFDVWNTTWFKLLPTDNSLELFKQLFTSSLNWSGERVDQFIALAWALVLFFIARHQMKKGLLL